MIRRTLYFSNPVYLSLKDEQMCAHFTNEDKELSFPIEDLGFVVLDNPQITITHSLMARFQYSRTALIVCDKTRIPAGQFISFDGHDETQRHTAAQVKSSPVLRKNLWKQIVSSKISNQAILLESLDLNAIRLKEMAKKVKSGDSNNLEAQAARHYWQELSPILGRFEPFQRDRYGAPPNNLLNYGYAILRAAVARALVGSGLQPILGIFHSNKYNPFCLADDMMEPFRPLVDQLVIRQVQGYQKPMPQELEKEHKKPFLAIPAMDVWINGETSPLMVGLQRTCASLVKCYLRESKKLILPVLQP